MSIWCSDPAKNFVYIGLLSTDMAHMSRDKEAGLSSADSLHVTGKWIMTPQALASTISITAAKVRPLLLGH